VEDTFADMEYEIFPLRVRGILYWTMLKKRLDDIAVIKRDSAGDYDVMT
jgi:hypothetical protein